MRKGTGTIGDISRRSRPADGSMSLAYLFAWFGGADVRALRESSTDRPFYSALGACALFFSLLSAFMVMTAVAYVTHARDPWSLWWIVPLWTAVMSSLERLILQIAGDRIVAIAIMAVPRLAVSVLIALAVGEMFALKAFEPEINDVITAQKLEKLENVGPALSDIYGPRITEAKGDIARLRGNERKVEQRIAREDLRAQQYVASEGGCGERCTYYGHLAADDRRQLGWMRERNQGRIADRRAEIDELEANRRIDGDNRRRAIDQVDGLLARKAALHDLQRKDAGVAFEVWLLRLLLISLDLSAFAAKVVRCLTVKDSAYDANVNGRRAEERLTGEERLERSRTEQARIRDEGRAARRRNKWRAEEQEFAGVDDDDFGTGGATAAAPIDGYALSEFTESMEDWERRPVVVPGPLRLGGTVGLALILLTAVAGSIVGAHGILVAYLAAVAGAALCVGTRGFRTAPAWALRAIFATFVGGLALPVVLLLLNL